MDEIELHVLNTQCLNRNIVTMDKMQEKVLAWQKHRNNKNAKINRHFSAKDAQIKLKRLYLAFID
jgi:hypothetical protein